MGIVHHSNFLRFFEEARMAWIKHAGISQAHAPHGDITMAVIETKVLHHRPAFLDDELSIRLQVRREGVKIRFAYAMFSPRYTEPVAAGETLHVPMNEDLKVARLPQTILDRLESEVWIETWPSNLFESRKRPR